MTDSRPQSRSDAPLLQVRGLEKHFPIRRGFFSRVVGHIKALDGADFDLHAGECLSLVGESGSGKSTLARCVVRAHRATSGSAKLAIDGNTIDMATADDAAIKPFRRHIQMIFQDPYASLNPRMTLFDIIGEPLLCHGMSDRREREARVRALLERVGLKPDHLVRYPHAFSGGQRQRIGIARALALEPKLVIADEPVSALDVSVQAQILNLLMELKKELALTYLFIAHDLSVVRHVSDRVAVMYVGKLVEVADVETLYADPQHPYTEALLSAVPNIDPGKRGQGRRLPGEVADPANPPSGCLFHPRCRFAKDRCRSETPALRTVASGHQVRCHFAGELPLRDAVD